MQRVKLGKRNYVIKMERKYIMRRRMIVSIFFMAFMLLLFKFIIWDVTATELDSGDDIYNEYVNSVNEEKAEEVSSSTKMGTIDFCDDVESFRNAIDEELIKRGIDVEHTNILLSILAVESGNNPYAYGDPFQSSESLGLESNTINSSHDSMIAAIDLYDRLLKKSERLGLNIFAVIQSYNYGPGFMDYLYENGIDYSFESAKNFSGINSSWETTNYSNQVSKCFGQEWRYKYGNYYYVPMVLKEFGYDVNVIPLLMEQIDK